jgi:hypothetical protein
VIVDNKHGRSHPRIVAQGTSRGTPGFP